MIVCNKCFIEKDDSDFYPRNRVCKECTKKRVSEYQKTEVGRDVHRAANKRYASTEKSAESRKRASDAYKSLPSSKKKQLAKWAVKRAVRVGILTRCNCESCGSDVNIHGHHCDYDRQLDVIWLCARCHKAWHMENGEGLNAN